MVTKTKCDKCGKEYEQQFFLGNIATINQIDVDLCKNCIKKFKEWLRQKK